MMKRLMGIILIFIIVLGCKGEEKVSENVPAKSIIPENKYALLIVESKSCIYCAQLKKDLKTEKVLKEALEGIDLYTLLFESYSPVRTNIGGNVRELSERELARELKATSFPNLIFYDKEGNIILQIPGYLPPDKLACVINYVKTEAFKKEKLGEYMKRC